MATLSARFVDVSVADTTSSANKGKPFNMTDANMPTGAIALNVNPLAAAALHAGNLVGPATATWLHLIGMESIPDCIPMLEGRCYLQ